DPLEIELPDDFPIKDIGLDSFQVTQKIPPRYIRHKSKEEKTAMDWLDVPYRLPELFVKYATAAREADKNEQDYIETDELGRVYLKTASAFKPVFDTLGAVQKPFGGPNPMLSMLLGGALGAGLGYG